MTADVDPFGPFRPSVARELRRLVDSVARYNAPILRQYLEDAAAEEARALMPPGCFCLFLTRSLGGDPAKTLPLAASVQLLSLSASVLSQAVRAVAGGRTGLVEDWGLALTLNAGDGFFSLGQTALIGAIGPSLNAAAVLRASAMLDEAALVLCEGMRLEMDASAEGADARAALGVLRLRHGPVYGAAASFAALAAGASPGATSALISFGQHLGMAAATASGAAAAAGNLVQQALTALDAAGVAIAVRHELGAAAAYVGSRVQR